MTPLAFFFRSFTWRIMILGMAVGGLILSCAPAQEYDLGSLPSYQAGKKQIGVIRIHGSQLSFHLIHIWQDEFLKLHPDIRYRDNILPSWFSGLCAGTEDICVMGHEAWRPDLMAFQQTFGYAPFEILFATGGFDQNRRGNSPGVVIMVNKDNPITGLTLPQLDGIFGAQRTGGWIGAQWSKAAARGPEKNIRTWGQAGLTGDWADKTISIYGTDATQSLWAGTIQKVVFKGGTKWNPAIHELVRGDHVRGNSDVQTAAAVAHDRYAIGFSFMKIVKANPGVKAVALAADESGPFISPTLDTFRNRTYPLVTGLYLYLNRPPGQPLPPRLKEFLTYILSREGQQAVVDDGMYIPLTPELAREQLQKID
ncbi:MAG: substrate-binding domain-containing protein [Opitutaceae bacterium]|nr:substrate-binding domain-containing protein [Opitutaceae bacterium]